jgi:hypothetical protein
MRDVMNIAVTSFASLAVAAASAAAAVAAIPVAYASDVDYLRASRCRGIAEGVGADGATLAAYLKQQEVARDAAIVQQGETARAQAKRQAKGSAKPQLEAELAGACAAYTGSPSTMANHPEAAPKG